jgi:hypothetical protein
MPKPELFDLTWEVLKNAGYCESVGSKQYVHVRSAWATAGAPDDISRFITKQVG